MAKLDYDSKFQLCYGQKTNAGASPKKMSNIFENFYTVD